MYKVKTMLETVSIKTELFFNNAISDLKIDKSRIELLKSIAVFIIDELKIGNNINLNFICTHNSRRSQLAQVWSNYAAHYFKLKSIKTFSGGTAVTAFYRNTVKTLQEVGFKFQISEFSHSNPEYVIEYENCTNPIIGFSKYFDDRHNKKPFIAITTYSNAEKNCPVISDTIKRFSLPFSDPKIYDNSQNQAEKYLDTNKQIAGEIHYIFKMINQAI